MCTAVQVYSMLPVKSFSPPTPHTAVPPGLYALKNPPCRPKLFELDLRLPPSHGMARILPALLLFILQPGAALLPQTGARGSHRSLRCCGVRACESEETRDSEETYSSSTPLQRADGSEVDDLRREFFARLSQMQNEDERTPLSRRAAPSAATGGVEQAAHFDSDFCLQVTCSKPNQRASLPS